MTSLPIVILAGGLATRMRPLTEKIPKSLLEVAGKPFVVHQIELLRSHGICRIVMCVGYLGEQIEALLGDGSRMGVSIAYSYDGPTLMGTGGAIRRALPRLGSEFLVTYGDSYLRCDYGDVSDVFLRSGKLGLMTVFHNVGRWDRSNVTFDGKRILEYDKKAPSAGAEYIDYGLGALRASVFDRYSVDEPLDLAEVYGQLVADDQLAGYEVTNRFYEIGSLSGLEETGAFLSSSRDRSQ